MLTHFTITNRAIGTRGAAQGPKTFFYQEYFKFRKICDEKTFLIP